MACDGLWRAVQVRGLGGNTKGSEGYGEITTGSMTRLCVLLPSLRQLVLEPLHTPAPGTGEWSAKFDLGEHASFVDLGSGYGKAVAHVAQLTRVGRSVGIECVISRHEIAEQGAPRDGSRL